MFIDPRSSPSPSEVERGGRTTDDSDGLTELVTLCREGRLYDVERWIRSGRPLQPSEKALAKARRHTSALRIAIDAGNHGLVLLLLCNGYDPDLDPGSPLDPALRARRWDLVDLLLEWGADPHRVDLYDLFGTYRSKLFERFRDLGVELTDRHVLAEALGYHTSNKPLFGFAKRNRKRDPKIQAELNVALAHHAEEGNEKGVALSLWAGADPHAPACNLRWCECGENADGDPGPGGSTAIERACRAGNLQILERLGPDPVRDDFDELYRKARSARVVEFLAGIEMPGDMSAVIRYHLWWSSFNWGYDRWESIRTLERLFEIGGRWKTATKDEIAGLRRSLLKASRQTFVDLMKLLAADDYCAPEILKELARTPAIRRKMTEVGFISSPEGDQRQRRSWPRPTRSREVLKKTGIADHTAERSKRQRPPLRRTVWIGSRRQSARELRLDRRGLFEHVWSQPVSKVAPRWGLSDQGLRKACRRLKIPVPPRGFWAKKRAGKRVHRPRLPALPEGQAEEIVVWVQGPLSGEVT